jgi:hypothetical protein
MPIEWDIDGTVEVADGVEWDIGGVIERDTEAVAVIPPTSVLYGPLVGPLGGPI